MTFNTITPTALVEGSASPRLLLLSQIWEAAKATAAGC